jgi:adenylosuccinate synthase
MPVLTVVGAQWGDEGKGKIVDLLAEQAQYVVRYQGGANAGHEVVVDGKNYVLHLVPSGILHKGTLNIVGNGVVLDPDSFLAEIEGLKKQGVSAKGRLFISPRAHLTLPLHKALDAAREGHAGQTTIGSTKRGISPTYMDKAGRVGIRLADVQDPRYCMEQLKTSLHEKNVLFKHLYKSKPLTAAVLWKGIQRAAKALLPYMADTEGMLNAAVKGGKRVLMEGAQGTLLDIDFGTYPYVTASNSTAGGSATGSGLGPTRIGYVLGVCKAYTTRVGEGPFPSALGPKADQALRELGGEYGRTTGRARRTGWLDLVALRYAAQVNGLDGLAITKLDILDTFKEIEVCVAYRIGSKEIHHFPATSAELAKAKPVTMKVKGWNAPTTGARTFAQLPKLAQSYLKLIERFTDVKVALVSVGAERSKTIVVDQKLKSWKF